MLTVEQEQLARAVDAMRANEAAIAVLQRDLESTRAERDAYYAHLESSQAEVTRLRLQVYDLESRLAGPFGVLPEIQSFRTGTQECALQIRTCEPLSRPASAPAPAPHGGAHQPASIPAVAAQMTPSDAGAAPHTTGTGPATSAQA